MVCYKGRRMFPCTIGLTFMSSNMAVRFSSEAFFSARSLSIWAWNCLSSSQAEPLGVSAVETDQLSKA